MCAEDPPVLRSLFLLSWLCSRSEAEAGVPTRPRLGHPGPVLKSSKGGIRVERGCCLIRRKAMRPTKNAVRASGNARISWPHVPFFEPGMAQAGGEGAFECLHGHVMLPYVASFSDNLAISLQDLSNRSSVWDPQRRDSPSSFYAAESLCPWPGLAERYLSNLWAPASVARPGS